MPVLEIFSIDLAKTSQKHKNRDSEPYVNLNGLKMSYFETPIFWYFGGRKSILGENEPQNHKSGLRRFLKIFKKFGFLGGIFVNMGLILPVDSKKHNFRPKI